MVEPGIEPLWLVVRSSDHQTTRLVKCGNACKKRKTGKESTFAELETVLFTWYQQARASNVPIDGTTLREKGENYSRPAEHR